MYTKIGCGKKKKERKIRLKTQYFLIGKLPDLQHRRFENPPRLLTFLPEKKNPQKTFIYLDSQKVYLDKIDAKSLGVFYTIESIQIPKRINPMC